MRKVFPQVLSLTILSTFILLRFIQELNSYQNMINREIISFPYLIQNFTVNEYHSCSIAYRFFTFFLPECDLYHSGEEIIVTGSIRPLSVKQIFGQKMLKVQSIQRSTGSEFSVKYLLVKLYSTLDFYREKLKSVLAKLPEKNSITIYSILFGNTDKFSFTDRRQIFASGLETIFTLSYYKVIAMMEFSRTVGKRLNIAAARLGIEVLVVFYYLVVLGSTVTLFRMLIILILPVVAKHIFHRQFHARYAFLIFIAALLLFNPFSIFALSFQFLVASVMGVVFFFPIFSVWFKNASADLLWPTKNHKYTIRVILSKCITLLAASCFISICLSLFTFPLELHYFGELHILPIFVTILFSPCFLLLTIAVILCVGFATVLPFLLPVFLLFLNAISHFFWLLIMVFAGLNFFPFSIHYELGWGGVGAWWATIIVFRWILLKNNH